MVEDHLDEDLDRAIERDHGLADVDELGRSLADAVATDELPRLRVEDELHHPVAVADDLAPEVVAEEGASHDDVEPSARSLLLAEPDTAHLGDREDPIGKEPGDRALVRYPERVAHRDARLLHRHGRGRREADPVARPVHARAGGSVVVVHDDVATGVDLDAGLLETHALGVTVPARG